MDPRALRGRQGGRTDPRETDDGRCRLSQPRRRRDTPPLDVRARPRCCLAAWGAGGLANRIGYPAVLGELGVGIILGPPLLGLLYNGDGLAEVGELGIILMMIYVGSEIDFDDLRRASKAGLLAAIGGLHRPIHPGLRGHDAFGYSVISAIFVGSAVGVTSLTTKSRILSDLQLFGTRLAYVLMAGALLSDTATLMIFAGVLSFNEGGADIGSIALVGGQIMLFVVLSFVGGAVLPTASRWARTRWGLDGAGFALPVFIVVGLGYGALAGALGLHPILGAFVGGMIVRRGMLDRRDFTDATRLRRPGIHRSAGPRVLRHRRIPDLPVGRARELGLCSLPWWRRPRSARSSAPPCSTCRPGTAGVRAWWPAAR